MLRRLFFVALVAAATTMPVGAESGGISVIQDLWKSLAEGRSGAPRIDRPERAWEGRPALVASPVDAAPVTASNDRMPAAETVNLLVLGSSLFLAARWLRRLPRRA